MTQATNQTGGPAFPLAASEYSGNGPERGMTLRDYFAAKAMQAMFSSPQAMAAAASNTKNQAATVFLAIASYEMADAMLQAR